MISRELAKNLLAVLLFTDQHFLAFHILFCKMANILDINLKFTRSIPDVNIFNRAKFREFSMPKFYIFKYCVFWNFGMSVKTQTSYVILF